MKVPKLFKDAIVKIIEGEDEKLEWYTMLLTGLSSKKSLKLLRMLQTYYAMTTANPDISQATILDYLVLWHAQALVGYEKKEKPEK